MKAVRIESFGGPDVLRGGTAPDPPPPGPGQALVRLKAAALNHLDIWIRSGERERNIPLPHIPGSDGAGIVEAVGESIGGGGRTGAAQTFKPGDKVVISPGLSCNTCAMCLSGRDNLCAEYRVLGVRDPGTYAELVLLPVQNVVPMPDGLSFAEAAAIPLVSLTAWHMLVTLAKLEKGETALVHGAGSGVGSVAIQIAKLRGARVITTSGSDAKLARARELGADETVNYSTSDFTEEVKRLTGKRGVDVVFEHVGGDVFQKSVKLLARGGRLVTCGATAGFDINLDVRYLYSRHMTLYGSWMGGKPEMVDVLLHYPVILRPVVDSVFPLAKAGDAHRRLESRENFGKIVLEI